MDYKRIRTGLASDRPLEGGPTLRFEAANIRRERTGVHATLRIIAGTTLLTYSTVNVERADERSKLWRSAKAHLNGHVEGVELALAHEFDLFCAGIWDSYVSQDIAEFMQGDPDAPPASFVLRPYVVDGGGTILFGAPGAGKSHVALAMAVSVDAGVKMLWQVQQRQTLFVNLERSRRSVESRLARVNKILGLEARRPLLTLNARGRSFIDVLEAARASVEKYQVGFVVLDSISRGGFGDLKEDATANSAVDALNGLAPAWLALAHDTKQSSEHVFGSHHFEAGADIITQTLSHWNESTNTLGVALTITKANDVARQPMAIYALEFGETGLKNFRQARKAEFIELENKRNLSLKDTVTAFLLDQASGEATASEVAAKTGLDRGNISKLFNNDSIFVETRKDKNKVYFGLHSNEGQIGSV